MKTLRPKNLSPRSMTPWRVDRRALRRRGLSSVLAMLFLVLFSTLAVGFYSAASMSAQVSKNERALNLADSAADGGMQFIRYHLGQCSLPPNAPSPVLPSIANQLGLQLNPTPNMQGHTVQDVNGVVDIPGGSDWVPLDPNTGTMFRARIVESGAFLIVSVEGSGPGQTVKKAIQMMYGQTPQAGAILDYGVASQGTISTGGSTVIQGLTDPTKGSVLSADFSNPTPVVIAGQKVSGDISIVNPNGTVSVSGASVGGTSDPTQIPKHIHIGVPAPTFPIVDTGVFTQYATTKYTSGMSTLNNVYIPPNTNPKFTGGATINGVLWIQAPNIVTFRGNTTITGVIVSDPASMTPTFDATHNQISFAGNVQATPINQLPTSSPAYNANLVKLTGTFLLAPNFYVSMTGNFGTVGGSIIAGQVAMTGNAGGTVQGSVVGMTDNPLTLNGNASITISSTGTSNTPSGISFGEIFTPAAGSYLEVTPW